MKPIKNPHALVKHPSGFKRLLAVLVDFSIIYAVWHIIASFISKSHAASAQDQDGAIVYLLIIPMCFLVYQFYAFCFHVSSYAPPLEKCFLA